MKKFSTFLIVAAMTFAFAACGGEKKTGEEATQEGTEAVEGQKEEAKVEAGSIIDQYIAILEKTAAIKEKVQAGDEAATEESMKLLEETMKLGENPEFNAEMAKPENIKKLEEVFKRLGMEE